MGAAGGRGAIRTSSVPKALGGRGSVVHTEIALWRFREVFRQRGQP